ncbi:disease resistance protein (TIR-NBS-LRR class) family [Artemisia annua]|uniref:Disease resistance protein (TIR-NBS-LRR class) family n=1 Tax=Artemisia annua TaxID=35608 RepID=A0A2U1QAV8_ARTAN|nr:disease resistance protein (TIR-NBS-LRR class) family [Artemisia annua]
MRLTLGTQNLRSFWVSGFRRLKVIKLRYCCNLTTTPNFSEITNLKELSLEGCANLVSVHPSIGMLKRLVVLNMRDCKWLQNFPCRVEMDALQVLNLTWCLKVDQLPEALGKSKSLTELHVDRTAITELPSFVSSLINLELLSFGGQGRIQPTWWTSITDPFGLNHIPKDQFHWKKLNLEGNNLLEVLESIGGLSCLFDLRLSGNNFTSLSGSLSQLSRLESITIDGCKKLEVLLELPSSLNYVNASDFTSLREISGSSKDLFRNRFNVFSNCTKLFKNVTIDSEGCISKIQCLDSSITSQGSIHQFSAFLGYLGFQTNRCQFFLQDIGYYYLSIVYPRNSIPEWFTNRSTENHAKVELPSDWCFNKFRGFGTCVVFKCKKPHKFKFEGYSVKNFGGASLSRVDYFPYVSKESYIIWLHYRKNTQGQGWKEAKNFVTFSFFDENKEDVEVKECGARLILDEDLQHDVTNLSMFQDLPTLSQLGGAMSLFGPLGYSSWSW